MIDLCLDFFGGGDGEISLERFGFLGIILKHWKNLLREFKFKINKSEMSILRYIVIV